ncbi:MAG: PAS domain S-box protein [Candidatus Altiarchaeota archaeon]
MPRRALESLGSSDFISVADKLNDIVFALNMDGRFIYVNKVALKLTGYKASEVINRKFDRFFTKKSAELSRKNFIRRVRGLKVKPYRISLVTKKKTLVELEVDANPIVHNGKIVGVLGVARNITEWKAAEDAIRSSEELYRGLVRTSPEAVTMSDLEGSLTFVSPQTLRLHGFRKPEDMLGKNALDFIAPEDRQRALKNLRKTFREGVVRDLEYAMLRKDRTRFTGELNAALVKNSQGKPSGFIAAVRDITKRKKLEGTQRANEVILKSNFKELQNLYEQLKVSEEKYKTLTENLNVGVYRSTVEGDGRFIESNPALIRRMGYKDRGEFLKAKVRDTYQNPKDRLKFIRKIRRQGFVKDEELHLKRKDGTQFIGSVSAVLVNDKKGSLTYIDGVIEDITERKKAVEALKESEERLRSVFNSMQDAFYRTDAKGRFVWVSPSTAKKLGYASPDDMLGLDVANSIYAHPKDRKKFLRDLKKSGWVADYEVELRRRDGSVFTVSTSSHYYRDKDGKVLGVEGIFRDITARKKAERELAASEAKYRSLFESSIEGIGISQGNRIVDANDALLKIYGYTSLDEFKKKQLLSTIAPSSRKLVLERIKKRDKGKYVPPRYELQIIRKNGEVRDIEISTTDVEISGKRYIQAAFHDITEEKRAQEAMLREKILSAGVITGSVDGILAFDRKFRYIIWNPGMERISGIKNGKALGRVAFDVFPFLKKTGEDKFFKAALRGETVIAEDRPYIVPETGNTGYFEGHYFPLRDEKGDILGGIAVIHDITERKRAQEEILSIKNHLETIINAIDEGLVVINRDMRIVSYNEAFRKSLRKPKKRIEGVSCYSVIHNFKKPCSYCVVSEMFKSGKKSADLHHHIEKGRRIWHDVRAYPLKDSAGGITSAVYVFRDVTKRMEMQEQLEDNYRRLQEAHEQLKELDNLKSEFVSIASHELQTPLTILRGYGELLQDETFGILNPKQKEKIDIMVKNIDALIKLVNDILDLSRIEAGQLEFNFRKLDVRTVVKDVVNYVRPAAERSGINLGFRMPSKIPLIRCDSDRLSQVVSNLLDNALKFTPRGGSITVSVSRLGRNIVIKIKDTGIGIPKGEVGKIFESFYQVDSSRRRKYKGVGLGLAVCKKIVEAHQGTIGVESEEGRGSIFSVVLPIR